MSWGVLHYRGLLWEANLATKLAEATARENGIIARLEAQKRIRIQEKSCLVEYIERQIPWSRRTFGEGSRRVGVLKHIRKELEEIESAAPGSPAFLEECCDVVILALDLASRDGHSAEDIMAALRAKQAKNFRRIWPAPISQDEPVFHSREGESA